MNTHGDGSVTLALTYSGTPASVQVAAAGGTFGSCTTGSCHNAATNIVWNATPTSCDICHVQGADLDDYDDLEDRLVTFVARLTGAEPTAVEDVLDEHILYLEEMGLVETEEDEE